MALTESFNKFAGKVINAGELREQILKAGFNLDTQLPSEQYLQKIEDQDSELLALAQDERKMQYLTLQTAKEIEQEVLNCDNLEQAQTSFYLASARHANGIYVDASHVSKVASFVYNNDKDFVEAYIKAVEACADHKDKIGKDTVTFETAIKNISRKAAAKFNP